MNQETCWVVTLVRGALHIDPCTPRDWPRYEAVLKTLHGEIRIVVENLEGVTRGVRAMELDGAPIRHDLPLADARDARPPRHPRQLIRGAAARASEWRLHRASRSRRRTGVAGATALVSTQLVNDSSLARGPYGSVA